MIPKDPMILLSFVNLKLRDFYSSLDDMCQAMNLDKSELEKKLTAFSSIVVVTATSHFSACIGENRSVSI